MREAFGVTSPLSGLRVDLADRELNEDITDDDRALALDARLLRRLLRDALVVMGGGWLERADDARERLLFFLGDVASSPSASDLPSSSLAADIASASALLLLLLVRYAARGCGR